MKINNIGRCISRTRLAGKCGFVHVFNNGVREQLFADIKFEFWDDYKSLNQGDIIKYNGEYFITKTGERTLRLNSLTILKRCEIGLPDKVNGIGLATARENPYLNLLSEIVSVDGATPYRDTLILKAKILKSIRKYLDEQGYIEVQTPILTNNGFGCDAKPFITQDGRYLRIAPELELKKLVVGGLDKVYEIGKNFRNEGLSQKHNPEFTMLELYAPGNVQNAIIELTHLLRFIILEIYGYDDSSNINGIDWFNFDSIDGDFVEGDIFQPTFVKPNEASPLAKHDENGLAERFELIVGGMEIANGYSEQDDWKEQLKAFEQQGFVDESYIDALKAGLQPTFGVGLGIDRLIMLLTNRNIREVL